LQPVPLSELQFADDVCYAQVYCTMVYTGFFEFGLHEKLTPQAGHIFDKKSSKKMACNKARKSASLFGLVERCAISMLWC
jgi:hypothetical protein